MDISAILEHFDNVSEEQDGYLAKCPAHPDTRPSLRLWVGDDRKVRLACRAMCKNDDVVKAAGLRWPDMFDVTGDAVTVPKERPELVSITSVVQLRMWLDSLPVGDGSYAEDRFGITTHDAERLGLRFAEAMPFRSAEEYDAAVAGGFLPGFVPRSFVRFPRMVVPLVGFDGVTRGAQGRDLSGRCPGRWISLSNPEGQRWAPYGVFRGEAGYGVTLVTEGPGDGLTAAAVGYDAVAIRGAALAGSPELIDELAAGLRGTQVIVAGDNDTAGSTFSIRLAEGLAAHGIAVYVLAIPHEGDDLTDWRERDPEGFAGALHRAVKAATLAVARDAAEAADRKAEVVNRTGARAVTDSDGADAATQLRAMEEQFGGDDGNPDAVNAYAFAAWANGGVKYAKGLGFMVWNGSVWECDFDLLRSEIHRMGAALALAGEAKKAKPFLTTSRIDALVTELRSVPGVKVLTESFDASHHLLNFRNGTVDLRTGRLRPHDKADLLTVLLPMDYDPEAQCPRWEKFLTEIFMGSVDMARYMQRLTGYGITGNTSEQCFAVLHGSGANGKSVLTETLTSVFGGITKTTPFATFEDSGSGGIPNDIAALRGARLVMASEGESGKPMSEAVLKRVTGKDKVTARFLRQEFFTFAPTFLIMLATNHKPKFRGQDEGLWRRVKLIPFERYFAPEERDYDLDRKLLAESAGIVAWAVRGAVEWYKGGLQDPSAISNATRAFRETSNTLDGFFPGVVVADPAATTNGAEVYHAYRDWCEAEGLQPKEVWSRTALYSALEERKISKKRTSKGMALVGIRLAQTVVKPTGPGIFGSDD